MAAGGIIPCAATLAMLIDVNYLVAQAGWGSLGECAEALERYALPRTYESYAAVLDRYTLPATLDDSLGYLDFFGAVYNLRGLYEHYFPQEFARSTKSIVPEVDEAYSEQEREFFDLVDTHLIPMPWFMEDGLGREERYYDLSLVPLGREWWNDGPEGWELGWLLLLWLLDEGDAREEIVKQRPDVAAALLGLPVNKGTIAFSALASHCKETRSPMAFLPQALNILWHDTGSWFLDIYSEDATASIEWTQRDLDRAVVHRRRAERVSRQADRFVEWIDEDPIPRFKEVITLWNRYCQVKEDNHLLLPNRFPSPER